MTTQTTPATYTDQRPTCSRCGSHNVETTAWVQYRPDGTAAVVNSEGPFGDHYGNWCHDCQEHLDLDHPDTTPADDARRQEADAAREAGPELLDLVADLSRSLRSFRDYHREAGPWSDSDAAALEAADEMLSRCAPAIRLQN